jgi:hypothetical protein
MTDLPRRLFFTRGAPPCGTNLADNSGRRPSNSSIRESTDINKITRKLAPKQMIISEEHRARWAFNVRLVLRST